MKRLASFGIWQPDWTGIEYPNLRGIGRFESDHFKPSEWKPEYTNPAFQNMEIDDAYWAARVVMSFSDDDIRTVVRAARLTDIAAENYLVRTLINRRDRIGRYWLTQLNSSDRFYIDGNGLNFEYLASTYGFAEPPDEYLAQWFEYDNERERKIPEASPTSVPFPSLRIPARFLRSDFHGYYGVELTEPYGSVVVFVRKSLAGVTQIVGIQRTPR